jgi:hypothetical protein
MNEKSFEETHKKTDFTNMILKYAEYFAGYYIIYYTNQGSMIFNTEITFSG